MSEWFDYGVTPTGVAPSVIGEMYWQFSILGVIAGMMFFGFVCGVVYKFAMLQKTNQSILLCYALFYTFVFFASEGPTAAMNGFIPIIFLTTVCLIFVNRGVLFSRAKR